MKKPISENKKLSAEEWVLIARKLGEDCLKIQKDSKISLDERLKKQKVLAQKIIKKIEEDAYLSSTDKSKMIESIENYMSESVEVNNVLKRHLSF